MVKSRLKIVDWAHTHLPPTTSGSHLVKGDTESEKKNNQQKNKGEINNKWEMSMYFW